MRYNLPDRRSRYFSVGGVNSKSAHSGESTANVSNNAHAVGCLLFRHQMPVKDYDDIFTTHLDVRETTTRVTPYLQISHPATSILFRDHGQQDSNNMIVRLDPFEEITRSFVLLVLSALSPNP
jgi:hypothetical protein